jgi:hypothetical protein
MMISIFTINCFEIVKNRLSTIIHCLSELKIVKSINK